MVTILKIVIKINISMRILFLVTIIKSLCYYGYLYYHYYMELMIYNDNIVTNFFIYAGTGMLFGTRQ